MQQPSQGLVTATLAQSRMGEYLIIPDAAAKSGAGDCHFSPKQDGEEYLMQQPSLGLVLLCVGDRDQLKELGSRVKQVPGWHILGPDVDPDQPLRGSINWRVQGHSLQKRFSQFFSIQGKGSGVRAENHMKIRPHSLRKPFRSSLNSCL